MQSPWLAQGTKPSFRLAASVDQFRGEAGSKERPDLLDDPDTSILSLTKFKAFLNSIVAETHTAERWSTSKFKAACMITQSRAGGYIHFAAFMDIIAPVFP